MIETLTLLLEKTMMTHQMSSQHKPGLGSIGILINFYTETEIILLPNGGPQPTNRHVSSMGLRFAGNL